MAASISGDDDEPISQINVTPFVDIILVVLIIFMVTTPIIMKPSINVNLPKAASGEQTSPSLHHHNSASPSRPMVKFY
jgi:biopolymer transport protein ExbD